MQVQAGNTQRLKARHLMLGMGLFATAAAGFSQSDAVRVTHAVDETKLVALTGNTHPLAMAKYDMGPAPDTMPLHHLFLVLKRSPEQAQALDAQLKEMQTVGSPSYHHWLTAEELGRSYGPAQADIDTVVTWLGSHGLQVDHVSKNGLTIDVTGTVSQIRDAFHTEIHNYNVKGERYIANAGDPQIPAALAPVVAGFNSLNSFRAKSLLKKRGRISLSPTRRTSSSMKRRLTWRPSIT